MKFITLKRTFVVAGCLALMSAFVASVCCAGSTVHVGTNVSADQRVDVERIDHSMWDSLLKKYVDEKGYVDYRSWKASSSDQQLLDRYLNHLSSAQITRSSSREAQLAFWINAYNAVTVKGILREYPTTSIRKHTSKLGGYNIWKDLKLTVSGRELSLEHQVLRKMGEPRIHFAIVCASIGCPRLLNEAYTADRIDQQLATNTKSFFSDRSKFYAQGQTIYVSPILDWFAEDFGPNTAAQMKTIAPYLPESAQALALSGRAKVKYLDYDWGLNDRAALKSAKRN